jgi:type II secretory pathway component PulF
MGDPLAQDEVLRIRTRVREGASLHGALAEGDLFPDLLGQLVAVGEEAGQLQVFLDKAAEIFEQSTQRNLQRLVAIAEPLMIVIFGGIVGLVALSLLQAIYGINAGSFR